MQKTSSRIPSKDSQSQVTPASKSHRRSSEHGTSGPSPVNQANQASPRSKSSAVGYFESPPASKTSKSQKNPRRESSSSNHGTRRPPLPVPDPPQAVEPEFEDEDLASNYAISSNPFAPARQASYISEDDESADSYAPTHVTESPSVVTMTTQQERSEASWTGKTTSTRRRVSASRTIPPEAPTHYGSPRRHSNLHKARPGYHDVEDLSDSEVTEHAQQYQSSEYMASAPSIRSRKNSYRASCETDAGTEDFPYHESRSTRGFDPRGQRGSRPGESPALGEVALYESAQVELVNGGRGAVSRAMSFPTSMDPVVVPGYVADRFVGHATRLISQTIDAEKQNAASKTGLKYEQRINARMAEELKGEKTRLADLERRQREQQTTIANQAAWLEAARHEANDWRSRLESAQGSITRLQAQLRSAEAELRESTALVEHIQTQQVGQQHEMERMAQDLNRVKEDRDMLRRQLESTSIEKSSLSRKLDEKRKERDRLRSERETLQGQVESLEWDKWDLTKKLNEKKKEVERMSKELKCANTEAQRAQAAQAEAMELASSLDEDLASCQHSRDEAQEKVKRLEDTHNDQIQAAILREEQQSGENTYTFSWLSFCLRQSVPV